MAEKQTIEERLKDITDSIEPESLIIVTQKLSAA